MDNLESEKHILLESPIGKTSFCKKLINETFRKVVRRVKNLDTINSFPYQKEKLTTPESLDLMSTDEIESFKQEHFDILPKDDVSFYEKKYDEVEKRELKQENSELESLEKSIFELQEKKIKQKQQELDGINRSLHDAAIKKIDADEAAWYLSEVQKIREELWDKLKKRLEELAKIKDSLEKIDETGVFWDLCQTDAFSADIETLMKWSTYLEDNEEIQKLLEMLGRAFRQKSIKKKELFDVEYTVPIVVPSIDSKEEIKSIELGNDLMRIVPQELIYLDNDELELLFYKKYAEKTLLCYHLEGQDVENITKTKQEEREVEEKEKKGPIIICVDTSGSMSGLPENIAKACALTLSSQAIKEDRQCHIINFSTKIITFTIDENIGMEKLLEFLGMSFWGGTDVTPALDHALEQMQGDEFNNSDLLLISDFCMGEIPDETLDRINEQKEKETKFYGLNIGYEDYKPEFLDKQWVFNPNNNCILELADEIA